MCQTNKPTSASTGQFSEVVSFSPTRNLWRWKTFHASDTASLDEWVNAELRCLPESGGETACNAMSHDVTSRIWPLNCESVFSPFTLSVLFLLRGWFRVCPLFTMSQPTTSNSGVFFFFFFQARVGFTVVWQICWHEPCRLSWAEESSVSHKLLT